MPPKTSSTEVALLFAVVIVVGVSHWMGSWLIRRKPEALEHLLEDVRGKIPVEDLMRIAVQFDRGWISLLLCIVPYVGFLIGNTCTSLLRDQGYTIFPWIVLLGPSLAFILMVTCARMRLYLLKKKVDQKVTEVPEFEASLTASARSKLHDDNPYAPPTL